MKTNKELLKTINNARNELSSVYTDIQEFNSVRYCGDEIHLTAIEVKVVLSNIINKLFKLNFNEQYCFKEICQNSSITTDKLSSSTLDLVWYSFKEYCKDNLKYLRFNVGTSEIDGNYFFTIARKRDYVIEQVNNGFLIKKNGKYIVDYLGVPLLFHSEGHFLQYSDLLKAQGLNPWG